MSKEKKKRIKKKLEEYIFSFERINIKHLIEKLKSKIRKYKDKGYYRLTVISDCYWEHQQYNLEGERLETDLELKRRINEQRKSEEEKEIKKLQKFEVAKQHYLRNKKKYEGKDND